MTGYWDYWEGTEEEQHSNVPDSCCQKYDNEKETNVGNCKMVEISPGICGKLVFIELIREYADGRGHNPIKRKPSVIITVVWGIVQFFFLMLALYVAAEMGDQDKSAQALTSEQYYDDALAQDNASQSSMENYESNF